MTEQYRTLTWGGRTAVGSAHVLWGTEFLESIWLPLRAQPFHSCLVVKPSIERALSVVRKRRKRFNIIPAPEVFACASLLIAPALCFVGILSSSFLRSGSCCVVHRYEEAERIEELLKSGALEGQQNVSEKEAVAA